MRYLTPVLLAVAGVAFLASMIVMIVAGDASPTPTTITAEDLLPAPGSLYMTTFDLPDGGQAYCLETAAGGFDCIRLVTP